MLLPYDIHASADMGTGWQGGQIAGEGGARVRDRAGCGRGRGVGAGAGSRAGGAPAAPSLTSLGGLEMVKKKVTTPDRVWVQA